MKNSISIVSITTLLATISSISLADNRVPAELAEVISPHYRYGDMKCPNGTQFVWVKRIAGHDSKGRVQTLFHDDQGALLPLDRLTTAIRLINPLTVAQKGNYHALHVQLGDKVVAIERNTSVTRSLPASADTQVTLSGQITVNKFDINPTPHTDE